VAMPRMGAADAAGLALQIGAGRGLARPQVAHWRPLLDYCAGNPLTLRIIAGQAVRMGLHTQEQIAAFVQAVANGEQQIQDADAMQGRDKSLGASLDYGFRNAFRPDEQAIIALLHLFQGTVDVDALVWMGEGEFALPELTGRTREQLAGLLDRAQEAGLLTHLDSTYYTIHPALPWYLRQLFGRHYDGREGRSTAGAALRAWVEATGELGNYYFSQDEAGNRDVIGALALEEANLLHAQHTARRQGWWGRVTSAMQGLRALYQYQSRTAEWARLVAEITPDYCTADDMPIAGREDWYSLVMEYRVNLARRHDRDLLAAATLQEKRIGWDRGQAAAALALPLAAALDEEQCYHIYTLGTGVEILGHILREQGRADCVAAYEEAIRHYLRTGDTAAEAVVHYNLGRTYTELPAIRDLDDAEAAYRRSLACVAEDHFLGRSEIIQAIGSVHHERFAESRRRGEPAEIVLAHARAAEAAYLQALALCPGDAIAHLGSMHNELGNLYREAGQTEPARERFERAVQIFELTGDRYRAGGTRYNLALMYGQAAERESAPARRRDLLRRASAYAESSLRDFQHYQGRAADKEAKAQGLIDEIARALET